jgi:catechol 2,3-dioxygenase-like lactoylglutathione lyase family enzyme
MVRTQGLTHIHLVVRDLERSLRFYEVAFGVNGDVAHFGFRLANSADQDPDGYVIGL